jgi:hypothetical protein
VIPAAANFSMSDSKIELPSSWNVPLHAAE